jgi:predicted regulator of Ras-like GTPase activity (Roadblock/LC7/MglB family)
MENLPRLNAEDIYYFENELRTLLEKTEATTALIVDQGGFLITSQGGSGNEFDLTTIAALASGAYLANQTISNLVREENFSSIYQEGEKYSMLVASVDTCGLLVIIFETPVGVGVVKYFAAPAIRHLIRQIKMAREREPDTSIDLSMLNLADTSDVFKKGN